MQVLARTLIDTVLFPCSHNRVRLSTSMGWGWVREGVGRILKSYASLRLRLRFVKLSRILSALLLLDEAM